VGTGGGSVGSGVGSAAAGWGVLVGAGVALALQATNPNIDTIISNKTSCFIGKSPHFLMFFRIEFVFLFFYRVEVLPTLAKDLSRAYLKSTK
jgi:hypothetical protein